MAKFNAKINVVCQLPPEYRQAVSNVAEDQDVIEKRAEAAGIRNMPIDHGEIDVEAMEDVRAIAKAYIETNAPQNITLGNVFGGNYWVERGAVVWYTSYHLEENGIEMTAPLTEMPCPMTLVLTLESQG